MGRRALVIEYFFSTYTIEIGFCLWVARSKVRRAWESLVLRPTPTLRFGRATHKYKVNRTGRFFSVRGSKHEI
jgi:hypothetical protein